MYLEQEPISRIIDENVKCLFHGKICNAYKLHGIITHPMLMLRYIQKYSFQFSNFK